MYKEKGHDTLFGSVLAVLTIALLVSGVLAFDGMKNARRKELEQHEAMITLLEKKLVQSNQEVRELYKEKKFQQDALRVLLDLPEECRVYGGSLEKGARCEEPWEKAMQATLARKPKSDLIEVDLDELMPCSHPITVQEVRTCLKQDQAFEEAARKLRR